MDITPLKTADSATIDQVCELLTRAHDVDCPGAPPLCQRLLRRDIAQSSVEYDRHTLLGYVDNILVGCVAAVIPLRENLQHAAISVTVHPNMRRQGFGTQLLEAGIAEAQRNDRTILSANVSRPLPGSSDWNDSGHGFATAFGAQAALAATERVLDLTGIDWAGEQAIYDDALAASGEYELLSWYGGAPDEHLAEIARLQARISVDVPSDDLDVAATVIDTDRIRREERAIEEDGGTLVTVAARRRRDVTLAGYVQLRISQTHGGVARLTITLVDPGHRGHRLGVRLKIAAHRKVRSELTEISQICTSNADSNTRMIAINDALGYQPTGRFVMYQYKRV